MEATPRLYAPIWNHPNYLTVAWKGAVKDAQLPSLGGGI